MLIIPTYRDKRDTRDTYQSMNSINVDREPNLEVNKPPLPPRPADSSGDEVCSEQMATAASSDDAELDTLITSTDDELKQTRTEIPTTTPAASKTLPVRSELVRIARALLRARSKKNPPGFYAMKKSELAALISSMGNSDISPPTNRVDESGPIPAIGGGVALAQMNIMSIAVLEKWVVPSLADPDDFDMTGAAAGLGTVRHEIARGFDELIESDPDIITKYFTPRNRAIYSLMMLNCGAIGAAVAANASAKKQ